MFGPVGKDLATLIPLNRIIFIYVWYESLLAY